MPQKTSGTIANPGAAREGARGASLALRGRMRQVMDAVLVLSLAGCGGRDALLSGAARSSEGQGREVPLAFDGGSSTDASVDQRKCTFKGFASSVSYATTDPPLSVIAVDLARDGRVDLLVGEIWLGVPRLEIFTNAGDGQFVRSPLSGASGNNLTNLVAADFNGDGFIDLASQSGGADGLSVGTGSSLLAIDFGLGGGAFASALVTYPSPQTYGLLTVGDFNGDGWPDLGLAGNDYAVLAGYGLPTPEPVNFALNVFFNTGDGRLAAPVSYANRYWFRKIASGDFNGDGHLDIAEITSASACEFGVFYNRGDGRFRDEVTFAADPDWAAYGLGVADFNGDGIDDIATTTTLHPNADNEADVLQVFTGAHDNSFYGPDLYPVATLPSVAEVVTGDFNGDGKPDIAMVMGQDSRGFSIDPIPVAVFENQGNGAFAAPVTYSVGDTGAGDATAIATGDFNGDGVTDIAVTTSNRFPPYRFAVNVILSRCE